jgi:hypothetical protein
MSVGLVTALYTCFHPPSKLARRVIRSEAGNGGLRAGRVLDLGRRPLRHDGVEALPALSHQRKLARFGTKAKTLYVHHR